MKRHLAWPIALPLAVISTLAGHAVGYRAAVPDAHEREHLLASSGHGYLEYVPLIVGLATAAVGLAFCAALVGSFRGRRPPRMLQIQLVAAIPPLGFVAQEFLERYLHDGEIHAELLLTTPFVLGLAVQLPFALLVAAVAYALTDVARRLGAALAAPRRPRVQAAAPETRFVESDLPTGSALSRGYTGRGPPHAPAH